MTEKTSFANYMKILIVDPDTDSSSRFEEMLKWGGFPCIFKSNSAQDALRKLGIVVSGHEISGIDLVLMDINMHHTPGTEACRWIRDNKRFTDLPIILMSADPDKQVLMEAFKVGATDYIMKSVDKIELLARIQSALRLQKEMNMRRAREEELMVVTRELREANEKLNNLSWLDGLTEIPNRRHLQRTLENAWKHASRSQSPLSLIMIDIDYFKAYNDKYGHQKGDNCLKQVASTLQKSIGRSNDVVGRYGGEEFMVILPNSNIEGAETVGQTLRSNVESLEIKHEASQVKGQVTISVGVASVIPSSQTEEAILLAAADRALYQSKNNGRNRVEVSRYLLEF